jgi:NADH-quinone oxidoreductase subunit L
VSGIALTVTLGVGLVTALAAGLLACVQHDIKKVLAYSTISQLGFMFIALGAGGSTAALYHLVTHAYFKSLLFLGAGSVIHALHTQDMREMGGLSKKMKWTAATFTVGTLALAGIVPFSGFFSKDLILDELFKEHHYVFFGMALFTAFLTAFYMTRLWLRVFTGQPRDVKKYDHAHESDFKMIVPMVVLAALTIVGGFTIVQFGAFIGSEAEAPQLLMGSISTLVALSGVGTGWLLFGKGRGQESLRTRFAPLHKLVFNKYYLDDAGDGLAAGYFATAGGAGWFDRVVVDGIVRGIGDSSKWAGEQLRRIQTGRIQTYQRLALAGAIVIVLVAVLLKGA